MKVCTRCKEEKHFDEFYTNRKVRDGKDYRCKSCVAEYRKNNLERCRKIGLKSYYKNQSKNKKRAREYYYKNKDRINELSKTPHGREMSKKGVNSYSSKHPDRHKTHVEFALAKRSGLLEKKPCEICGTDKKIHGHHEDYNKPLDVNWLCRSCHDLWHNIKREWGSMVILTA